MNESTPEEKSRWIEGPAGGVIVHRGLLTVKIDNTPEGGVAWTESMLREKLDWVIPGLAEKLENT